MSFFETQCSCYDEYHNTTLSVKSLIGVSKNFIDSTYHVELTLRNVITRSADSFASLNVDSNPNFMHPLMPPMDGSAPSHRYDSCFTRPIALYKFLVVTVGLYLHAITYL